VRVEIELEHILITLYVFKSQFCMWKSHPVCRNHTCLCCNHILRVEITSVLRNQRVLAKMYVSCVILTRLCVKFYRHAMYYCKGNIFFYASAKKISSICDTPFNFARFYWKFIQNLKHFRCLRKIPFKSTQLLAVL
jgi:hypothetical protein